MPVVRLATRASALFVSTFLLFFSALPAAAGDSPALGRHLEVNLGERLDTACVIQPGQEGYSCQNYVTMTADHLISNGAVIELCPDEKAAIDLLASHIARNRGNSNFGGEMRPCALGDGGGVEARIVFPGDPTTARELRNWCVRVGRFVLSYQENGPVGGLPNRIGDQIRRLRGEDPDAPGQSFAHGELIAQLRKYRPLLFKDAPDADLDAALETGETRGLGRKTAPTGELREAMAVVERFVALADLKVPPEGSELLDLPEVRSKGEKDFWNTMFVVEFALPPQVQALAKAVRYLRTAQAKALEGRRSLDLSSVNGVYEQYRALRKQHDRKATDTTVDVNEGEKESLWALDAALGFPKNSFVRSSKECERMGEAEYLALLRDRFDRRFAVDQVREAVVAANVDREDVIAKMLDAHKEALGAIFAECEQIRFKRENPKDR